VILQLKGVESGYVGLQVLWGVGFEVLQGSCVVVLGANGAGKSTTLATIMGLVDLWSGSICFLGESIAKLRTDQRVGRGIAYMTEKAVFADMSVQDNLALGAFAVDRRSVALRIEEIYEAFPALRDRRRSLAGSLSGGQRKLVGVAKALACSPKLIVMDEPSSGLSPLAVKEVISALSKVQADLGTSMLIAEQNVAFTEIAERVVVIEGGRVGFTGTVSELESDDALRKAFFGLGS
jgi:branched-chain amino acid transport system ATP-binding protein